MADAPREPPRRAAGKNGEGGRAARERRLAEALRANLRRRKAQSRARRDGGGEGGASGPPPA